MTIDEIKVPGDLHTRLVADVAGPAEWAGYLLCGIERDERGTTLLGRDWVRVPDELQVRGTEHGFSWHPDFDVEMLNRAQREQLSCVVLHYHGGTRPTLGYSSDQETAQSLMPFLSREVAERPHVFGVLGDRAISGLVFENGSEVGTVNKLRVSGSWLDDWGDGSETQDALAPVDLRQDRLVRGFGEEALRRVRASRVAVVGCGGGGSHVIQQLAYLGVGALVIVDGDLVEITNLNRLIGAVAARKRRTLLDRLTGRGGGDVGRLKVDVMARMVASIDEDIDVTKLAEKFPSRQTVEALRGCDVVVACVDKLQVRDDLNRFAKRYLIPLLDVGLEITPSPDGSGEPAAIPGRVGKVLADGPCLRCQGIIDDRRLEAERGGRPMGYTGEAGIPDPAVVTLNGIVASVAATEVLQIITGFARETSPNCGWIYDGLRGQMERVAKEFRGCSACTAERARGDI